MEKFLLVLCGGSLLLIVFFATLIVLAYRSDKKWKSDANYTIAHNLLDSGTPRWSGRTRKDPGIRKVSTHGRS